ncbi:MAG: hypothetical protein JW716_03745 [Candidatus Aenigmarchaeota archaeon]|nr:hypothetical protein [Candidatus Aenigmarchaeota archaeon]
MPCPYATSGATGFRIRGETPIALFQSMEPKYAAVTRGMISYLSSEYRRIVPKEGTGMTFWGHLHMPFNQIIDLGDGKHHVPFNNGGTEQYEMSGDGCFSSIKSDPIESLTPQTKDLIVMRNMVIKGTEHKTVRGHQTYLVLTNIQGCCKFPDRVEVDASFEEILKEMNLDIYGFWRRQ